MIIVLYTFHNDNYTILFPTLKFVKVKECYEKAEPASSSGAPGKSPQAPRPATAPAKASSAPPSEAPSTQSVQRVPSKRPETANPVSNIMQCNV